MTTIQNIALFVTYMMFFGAVDIIVLFGIAVIVDYFHIGKELKEEGCADGQADN